VAMGESQTEAGECYADPLASYVYVCSACLFNHHGLNKRMIKITYKEASLIS